MSESAITLSLTGKISYEDQITVVQATKIINYLNSEEPDAEPRGGGEFLREDKGVGYESSSRERGRAELNEQTDGRVASAREALDISGAKTNPEKIVALGQYVMQDGTETFKVEDVKTQFRRAREAAPANFSRDISIAVREGWLAEAKDGEYYVTNKMQAILEGGFKYPRSGAGGGGKTRSTSTVSKEKPSVFAGIDEFPTQMDGLAAYFKMKSEGNRVLWVLLLAKRQGIKGLSNKDIAWLTDHLGVGVPGGNIGGAIRGPRSAGYLNRSTSDNTLRITDSGEAHLQTASAAG